MRIFYSVKNNSFFNEVFHGTRTIQVLNPDWVRPTVPVPDPGWTTPDIEVPNPAWSDGDDEMPKTIWVPDSAAVAPMIEVPDTSAIPPLIVVPNPECLLPPESELVDITQDEHDEIFRVLSLGGSVLAPRKDGRPTTVPAPGPTLDELKDRARVIRDRELLLTDPLIARHRDQVEAGRSTTLSVDQYQQLQGYRQDLRDWPDAGHFPAVEYRPVQPDWLAEQLQ